MTTPTLLLSNEFKRAYKRLSNPRRDIADAAIKVVLANPRVGRMKHGTLIAMRVHKFSDAVAHLQMLLGYVYDSKANAIQLRDVDTHDNFYKRQERFEKTRGRQK